MQSPVKVARVILAVLVGSVIFLEFWKYSALHALDPTVWTDVLNGTAEAPAQYRIGVIFFADFIARHAHAKLHQALTLIDLISLSLLVASTSFLFFRSSFFRAASLATRWFGAATFCLLTITYLAWLTWYIRPETMTNAAVIALTLVLLKVQLPLPPSLATGATITGMVALAAISGLVRADMAVSLHLGILLVTLVLGWKGMALSRPFQVIASALCVLVGGGFQYYMMHIRYPHSTYGKTPVFQLADNLRDPSNYVVLLLALFPFWWTAANILRRKIRPDFANLGVFAGSLLFLVSWEVLGRVQEIRIFLPYALALVPLTSLAAMHLLVGGADAGTADAL